jgi:Uma2 family endonuclease
MRAVIPTVPPDILAFRKLTGADRWDEMWEGVLHMAPAPNREHNDFEWSLEDYLRRRWARAGARRVYHQINLCPPGGWPHNYRIPDLVLLNAARFAIDRNEYFEGAPNVVVEIRSRGDESYEKLEFYARLGVPEVWILDRDTKAAEIFNLDATGAYIPVPASALGWIESSETGLRMRQDDGKLAMKVGEEPDTLERLPEDQ